MRSIHKGVFSYKHINSVHGVKEYNVASYSCTAQQENSSIKRCSHDYINYCIYKQ